MTVMPFVSTISLTLGLFFIILVRVIHTNRLHLVDWALFSIAGIYGVGGLLITLISVADYPFTYAEFVINNSSNFLRLSSHALILTSALLLGWAVTGGLTKGSRRYANQEWGQIQSTTYRIVAFMLLLCGFVAILLYTSAYGGPAPALEYTNKIRSGILDTHNPWSFLRPLTGLPTISTIILYGLYINRKNVLFGPRHYMWLFIALAASGYYFLLTGGRLSAAIFVMVFPLTKLIFSSKSGFRLALAGSFTILFLLVTVYGLSQLFNIRTSQNLLLFAGRELAFPTLSFFKLLEWSETPRRWFSDIITSPLYILPESIRPAAIANDISNLNTMHFFGARKGQDGVTATIPVDLLTLGYWQAWIPGIWLTGILYGAALRITQNFLNAIRPVGLRASISAYTILVLALRGIAYAYPNHLISGNIDLIIALVLVCATSYFVRSFSQSKRTQMRAVRGEGEIAK